MIFKNFTIIDYNEKISSRFTFSDKQNLIVGKTNKIGKSSIVKSLYYTLGFNNKSSMPSGWDFENMKFRVDYFCNGNYGYIIRQKDLFYVTDNDTALIEREYRDWLQALLGVEFKFKKSNSKDEHLLYPSAIIMPFCIDQDLSWDAGKIYRSPGMGQYPSTAYKIIFEKMFSVSNDDIQGKKNRVSELQKENNVLSEKIDVLKELIDEYSYSFTLPLHNDLIKKQDEYLKVLENINEKIKEGINEKTKISNKINKTFVEISNLELIEKNLNTKKNNLNSNCKLCGSSVTIEKLTTQLSITNNIEEIKYQIDMNKNNLKMSNLEMELYLQKEVSLKNEYKKYLELIHSDPDLSSIDNYILSLSENMTSDNLAHRKDIFEKKLLKNQDNIKILASAIRGLEKKLKETLEDISKEYLITFTKICTDDLKISDYNTDDRPFLNFNTTKGSGTDNNSKMLLIYLIYFHLLDKYSVVKIPFVMDSFIRTELDYENVSGMFEAVSKWFLKSNNQTFFTVLKENLSKVSDNDKYHKIIIDKKPILSNECYEEHLKYFDV